MLHAGPCSPPPGEAQRSAPGAPPPPAAAPSWRPPCPADPGTVAGQTDRAEGRCFTEFRVYGAPHGCGLPASRVPAARLPDPSARHLPDPWPAHLLEAHAARVAVLGLRRRRAGGPHLCDPHLQPLLLLLAAEAAAEATRSTRTHPFTHAPTLANMRSQSVGVRPRPTSPLSLHSLVKRACAGTGHVQLSTLGAPQNPTRTPRRMPTHSGSCSGTSLVSLPPAHPVQLVCRLRAARAKAGKRREHLEKRLHLCGRLRREHVQQARRRHLLSNGGRPGEGPAGRAGGGRCDAARPPARGAGASWPKSPPDRQHPAPSSLPWNRTFQTRPGSACRPWCGWQWQTGGPRNQRRPRWTAPPAGPGRAAARACPPRPSRPRQRASTWQTPRRRPAAERAPWRALAAKRWRLGKR